MRCGGKCRDCGPTGYTPATVQALQNQGLRTGGSRKAPCTVDTFKGRPCFHSRPWPGRPAHGLSRPTATCTDPRCQPPGGARRPATSSVSAYTRTRTPVTLRPAVVKATPKVPPGEPNDILARQSHAPDPTAPPPGVRALPAHQAMPIGPGPVAGMDGPERELWTLHATSAARIWAERELHVYPIGGRLCVEAPPTPYQEEGENQYFIVARPTLEEADTLSGPPTRNATRVLPPKALQPWPGTHEGPAASSNE